MSPNSDADPDEDTGLWERLRAELLDLRRTRPSALRGHPDPDGSVPSRPASVGLSSDSTALAARLHAMFGDFVAITVGALPYPLPLPASDRTGLTVPGAVCDTVDLDELRIELDGPLAVPRGEMARHAIRLTNLSDQVLAVPTGGALDGVIVDEAGRAVGGWSGANHAVLVRFTAEPGDTIRIPLRVGTDSLDLALGYAVPPGRWHLILWLNLASSRRVDRCLITPPLAITIE